MSEELLAAAEALADAAEAVLFFEGDHREELRDAWQQYVDRAAEEKP